MRDLAKELILSFNLLDVYIPLTQDLVRRQLTPAIWTKQFLLAGIDALQVTMQVPQQLRRILGDIERGGFEVNLQPASFDPYFERLQQVVNRILIALLAATCTISTAMIVAAYHPTGWDWVAEALFLARLALRRCLWRLHSRNTSALPALASSVGSGPAAGYGGVVGMSTCASWPPSAGVIAPRLPLLSQQQRQRGAG